MAQARNKWRGEKVFMMIACVWGIEFSDSETRHRAREGCSSVRVLVGRRNRWCDSHASIQVGYPVFRAAG
ncbi:hypothetical protein RRSWK_02328 [Rhodopirellula sp. SWK7]|nr:hypothetical protein RRSWK_02328 [Rhodopirellula sp. SWK7]